MRQAYDEKKYAFIIDYAGLKILYDNGGIYLDTDVEFLKRLPDEILKNGYIAKETDSLIATGLGFACEKNDIYVLRSKYYIVMKFLLDKEYTFYAKGIAILLVILGHMGIIDCGGAIGVHIFLIVSGYGIAVSLSNNGVNNYWIKRIKSVYLPYLLCMSILIMIKLLFNKANLINIIITLLGLDFNLNLDPTMWYISYIFLFYLLAWIYANYNSKFKYIVIAVIWFLSALMGYLSIVWHHGTVAWAYVFSFPLGFIIAKYRNIELNKIGKLLCLLVFVTCTTLILIRYGKPHGGIELLCYSGSSALAIMLIIYFLQKNKLLIFKKIINIFGVYSYFMYLNEGVLLSYKYIIDSYTRNPYVTNIIIIFLSFIIAKCLKIVFDVLIQCKMEKI